MSWFCQTIINEIVVDDPNRNANVRNIQGSVNVMFAIKTILQINSSVGYNNTPVLLNPPYDKAYKGKVFIHNPAAYDPDGDSLSYKLTTCLGGNGEALGDVYSYPKASNSLFVDAITGDLVWDTPTETGTYNVAMLIEEWRGGIKIGQITRDMQIEVYNTTNKEPVIKPINDICVIAGQTVEFDVFAKDLDAITIKDSVLVDGKWVVTEKTSGDMLFLKGQGGSFIVNESPSTFFVIDSLNGSATGHYKWKTNCSHIRKTSYQIIFKVEDNFNDKNKKDMHLFDYEIVNITVIAPPPYNVKIEPTRSSFNLSWDPEICPKANGYKIYRRRNASGFVPGECQTGVPPTSGFKLIKTNDGITNTTFEDTTEVLGLLPGVKYCYRIVATFPDGAQSISSDEVCDEIIRHSPIITNVDVLKTDIISGEIEVNWVPPLIIDKDIFPGPYKYLLFRSTNSLSGELTLIDSISDIEITSYIDKNIDTKNNIYYYKIEFWNVSTGNRTLIGPPQIASSNYLDIIAGNGNKLNLKIRSEVPWIDTAWVIYRQDTVTLQFDSIGVTFNRSYEDTGLEFNKTYCYKVKAIGYYNLEKIIDPRINHSQINCSVPIDTIPPEPPDLYAISYCDSLVNFVYWNYTDTISKKEVIEYRLYYSDYIDNPYQLIATLPGSANNFRHELENSLSASYYIVSVDLFGNESKASYSPALDSCNYYKLPNVITPNNDGKNDFFVPFNKVSVIKADIKIYNRWGRLVFETTDPEIRWNGTYLNTNQKVPDGVYYYVCDITEKRYAGLFSNYLVGFVHVINNVVNSNN